MSQLLSPAAVALIAILPAAFALWSGRRIAALADDAAIPERLLANRTRTGFVSGVCGALLVAAAINQIIWALPLLVLARLTAGYSIRKRLHGETWSLSAYFWFFLRLTFVVYGFWLLLLAAPWLIVLSGGYGWTAATLLAAAFFAWNHFYNNAFRTILRARPIEDPELVARFGRMVADCRLPAVALEQVDLRGGMFANAVALPSLRTPAIVLSSTLVDRMDRDETMAIIGHELAHIEHYNLRRMLAIRLVTWILIVAACTLPILVKAFPRAAAPALTAWPVVPVGVMVFRARRRQRHETESDLRAVALSGDPDALIRALTRLHAFARIPRRWDKEFERHATHPSLARRIQAIRAASGATPSPLGAAITFSGADGASSITFAEDGVLWVDRRSRAETIRYDQLTMLRVDVRRRGMARLVAVDSGDKRREIGLRVEDVARVQATLDLVDTRLAPAAAPAVGPLVTRALGLAVVIVALLADQFLLSLLGWLAITWPALPVTAALGFASIGGAALAWRDRAFQTGAAVDPAWVASALFVCGSSFVAIGLRNRHERTRTMASAFAAALGVLIAAGGGALAFAGIDAVDAHRMALHWDSTAILLLALAGAGATDGSRARRLPSALVTAAAFAVIYLGSTAFLDRFGRDPLALPAPPLTPITPSQAAVAELRVPIDIAAMRLSPSGRFIALHAEDEDENVTVHAGPWGGPLSQFTADESAFAGETQLLLLEREPDGSRLRVVDLDGGGEVWSMGVRVHYSQLAFDRRSRRWTLLGWNEAGDIAASSGILGSSVVQERTWPHSGMADAGRVTPIATSAAVVFAMDYESDAPRLRWAPLRRWFPILSGGPASTSRAWAIRDNGSAVLAESRLDLRCASAVTDSGAVTCTIFDGRSTRIVAVNVGSGRLTPMASLPGHAFFRGDAGDGWLSGWWRGYPLVFEPSTGSAIRIVRRGAHDLAVGDTTIAVASGGDHGSIVRLYPRDRHPSPSQ